MYPWFRFLRVLVAAGRRPRLAPLETSVVRFRVWPGDLDMNGHLNNGRYLTLMDLGRYDLVVRTGLMRVLLRRKWYPVVHSASIRFRRALDAWEGYEMHTRILGWDDRGFFMEQRFVRGGETVATGVLKGVFLGPEGKVPPLRIAEALGADPVSPPIPEAILAWQRSIDEVAVLSTPRPAPP